MQVRSVDPRDISVEIDSPSYRVYFWKRQAQDDQSTSTGYECDEYEISDADVEEVLSWAKSKGEGHSHVCVYAVFADSDGPGLIRLAGEGTE